MANSTVRISMRYTLVLATSLALLAACAGTPQRIAIPLKDYEVGYSYGEGDNEIVNVTVENNTDTDLTDVVIACSTQNTQPGHYIGLTHGPDKFSVHAHDVVRIPRAGRIDRFSHLSGCFALGVPARAQ